METIRGKASREMNLNELNDRRGRYNRYLIDLGTGDGRFALDFAMRNPDWFVIGLDACRENLREHSRSAQRNLLFAICEAQSLPWELTGMASRLTINFPWGSLLSALLSGESALMRGLASISNPQASLEIRLNGGALAEAGVALDAGTKYVRDRLMQAGWLMEPPQSISVAVLRNLPSTWARRLAFGRDPRAMQISGWLARRT